MKRRIFFWLEKLKISSAERKSIAVLMVVLLGLSLCNWAMSPAQPFAEGRYLELREQFKQRTAKLRGERKKRMERYFPTIDRASPQPVVLDTVPEEKPNHQPSADQPVEEKERIKKRINVNKADREALKALPGIGPAYSKRIIVYREKNGGFKTIEELKEIKGIGPKRLEKLKPFVKLKDSE